MCSLNLNLLSITVPKYFIVYICCRGLLFKYMLIFFFSFLILLNIILTLDLSSLKLILLFLDQAVILLISMFEIFSAALIVSFLITNIKSSAKATALEIFVNWMFSRELYRMFQYPGPQQDLCGSLWWLFSIYGHCLMKGLRTVG
jgi:hypothetical protein